MEIANKISTTELDTKTLEIAEKLLAEDDIDKAKDLTNLFNLNTQKRQVVRSMKLTELLDKVTDQMAERFESKPDNFTNEDLLKLMQVTESSIDKANKNLGLVETTPAIQMQQNNQVNINIVDGLDRDSRKRVTDAVQAILGKLNKDNIIEGNVTNG